MSGTVWYPTPPFLWSSLSVAAGRCTLYAELRTTSALHPRVKLLPSLTLDLYDHFPLPHLINFIVTVLNLINFGTNSTSRGKVKKNKAVETDY